MLKFALGVTQILVFLDTNIRSKIVLGPGVGLNPQRQDPTHIILRCSGIYIGFIVSLSLQNLRNRQEVSAREGAHLQVFHYQYIWGP